MVRLRWTVMDRKFTDVPLDGELAALSAEISHGHGFSLADSAIAVTAIRIRVSCSVRLRFSEVERFMVRWGR